MKSNAKIKIVILIALGLVFALSTIFTSNLNFNTANSNKITEYSDDINAINEDLKISKISGRIHIKKNWTDAKAAGICTGDGTYSAPYIIENLEIDGEKSGPCIWIENSIVYFIIKNCTAYNSGTGYMYQSGIRLNNVTNGQLINNNCSLDDQGILLWDCSNITISGNTLNNNLVKGIYLYLSNNNIISGNTANNNDVDGIQISLSYNNIISGNTANNNYLNGINLYIDSYNNTVSGNTANNNNDHGILLLQVYKNIISGNTANNNDKNGMHLYWSNNNTISGNTANYNQYGIYLERSNYTMVSGNQFSGNDKCWVELNCKDNVFEDNNCVAGNPAVPGYGIFFLIGIISITSIILILLKRRIQSKS